MTQPFAIGDRIHELASVVFCDCGDPECENPPRLDSTSPDAVVTAYTARGFMFRYDTPVAFGRVAWGLTVREGECLEAGFGQWAKAI